MPSEVGEVDGDKASGSIVTIDVIDANHAGSATGKGGADVAGGKRGGDHITYGQLVSMGYWQCGRADCKRSVDGELNRPTNLYCFHCYTPKSEALIPKQSERGPQVKWYQDAKDAMPDAEDGLTLAARAKPKGSRRGQPKTVPLSFGPGSGCCFLLAFSFEGPILERSFHS